MASADPPFKGKDPELQVEIHDIPLKAKSCLLSDAYGEPKAELRMWDRFPDCKKKGGFHVSRLTSCSPAKNSS